MSYNTVSELQYKWKADCHFCTVSFTGQYLLGFLSLEGSSQPSLTGQHRSASPMVSPQGSICISYGFSTGQHLHLLWFLHRAASASLMVSPQGSICISYGFSTGQHLHLLWFLHRAAFASPMVSPQGSITQLLHRTIFPRISSLDNIS